MVRTGKNIKILKFPYYTQHQVFSVQSGLQWSSPACLIITISTMTETRMELRNWAVKTESFKNFTEYRGVDRYLTGILFSGEMGTFFFLGVNIPGVMLMRRNAKHSMLKPASQKKKKKL